MATETLNEEMMSLDGTLLTCKLCKKQSPLITEHLGICDSCLRTRSEEARPLVAAAHAEAAVAAAHSAGLTNVRIGNRHLLSRDY